MKELKMNHDNNSNSDQDTNESQENSLGKVLPFRRPAPQPTLVRRPGNGVGTNQGVGRDKSKSAASAPWKGKVAQALQIVLLAAAFLLALKNCGKI
jgi:hypothetical protein